MSNFESGDLIKYKDLGHHKKYGLLLYLKISPSFMRPTCFVLLQKENTFHSGADYVDLFERAV